MYIAGNIMAMVVIMIMIAIIRPISFDNDDKNFLKIVHYLG